MTMEKYNSNQLWDSINSQNDFTNFDLQTFKNGGANNRIVQYNPDTHGMLFFKNIIFQMANSLGYHNLQLLEKIPNRHIGGGISIRYAGLEFDLDYLLSLEEMYFLKNPLSNISTIIEIGAGYGRTCHSILSIHNNIREYVIIDLEYMLNISRQYLKEVSVNGNYDKIKFVGISEIESLHGNYDLVINIDSMQEMEENIVQNYLDLVDRQSLYFYTKNTVGKYEPAQFGWKESQNSMLALNSGILKEVINIFCPKELALAQMRYLAKFCPSEAWKVMNHSTTLPWSHYYQALYKKSEK